MSIEQIKEELNNALDYFELKANQKKPIIDSFFKHLLDESIEYLASDIITFKESEVKVSNENLFILALIGKEYNNYLQNFEELLQTQIKNKDEEIGKVARLKFASSQSAYAVKRYSEFDNDQNLMKDITLRYLGYPRERYLKYVDCLYNSSEKVIKNMSFDRDFMSELISARVNFLKEIAKKRELFSFRKFRELYEGAYKRNVEYSLNQIEKGWRA